MVVEVATALLRNHEDGLVFQRRSLEHRLNPGKLGLFGGHFEPEDCLDPERALTRELAEETSLKFGELAIAKTTSFFIPKRITGNDLWYHLYDIELTECQYNFYVKDGEAEVIPKDAYLQRDDIEPAAQFALARMEEFKCRLV